MKKFVVFGAGLALGGIAGYFGYKKFEDMKKAKRVAEKRTYTQYNYSRPYSYASPMRFKNVRFMTKEKAEEVLDKLIKIVGEYNRVTVADFYGASGMTTPSYTDYKWGWMDWQIEAVSIYCSYVDPVGWYLDLPDPVPID